MTLREYLDEKGESPLAFGRRIGLKQPGSVYRWLRGDRIPSRTFMRKIVDATNGQVTANDFV